MLVRLKRQHLVRVYDPLSQLAHRADLRAVDQSQFVDPTCLYAGAADVDLSVFAEDGRQHAFDVVIPLRRRLRGNSRGDGVRHQKHPHFRVGMLLLQLHGQSEGVVEFLRPIRCIVESKQKRYGSPRGCMVMRIHRWNNLRPIFTSTYSTQRIVARLADKWEYEDADNRLASRISELFQTESHAFMTSGWLYPVRP